MLPGMSQVPRPTIYSWIVNSPFLLITTPNFIWVSTALVIYFSFPYNLGSESAAAIAPISQRFLAERLPIWIPTIFGYFSFCHAALYFFNAASRPFIANRIYNIDKVVHNVFWTLSGIVIWTMYENVFCYLWATGRLPYVSNAVMFGGSLYGLLQFVGELMGIPVWRSVHFYFAHRFLHYGPLYQQVHSLHHRNTDIEPFAGLCMHPVEHLYYYACVLPSLVFYCSPFALLWNGVHLLMSPAASHSGWEDNFQSDVFHYMHHRYFECNYAGTDAGFMDLLFGTFKGSMDESEKDGPKARADAKSTLRSIPTTEFITYLSGSYLCFAIWAYVGFPHADPALSKYIAAAISLLTGFGPILLAVSMSYIFGKGAHVKPAKMSLVGNAVHIVGGTLFCSIPVSYATWLSLKAV